MRTLSIAAVVGLLVGLAMLGRGRAINKGLGDAGYTCNRIAISGSGLVSILGTTAQYQIAPLNRGHYPQLRAVAAVDLDHEVYLARFFEPGGTGVQSFYDVCFRIQNGRVFSKTIDAAAAIERIGNRVLPRSVAYVFDYPTASLGIILDGGTNASWLSFADFTAVKP